MYIQNIKLRSNTNAEHIKLQFISESNVKPLNYLVVLFTVVERRGLVARCWTRDQRVESWQGLLDLELGKIHLPLHPGVNEYRVKPGKNMRQDRHPAQGEVEIL
jgi:hypothetical protein